jgi:hypothetical protein
MYALIKNSNLSIRRACPVLGVSRSGYNKWLKHQTNSCPKEMRLRNENFAKLITLTLF